MFAIELEGDGRQVPLEGADLCCKILYAESATRITARNEDNARKRINKIKLAGTENM